jgi:hypothetical protein
MTMTPETIMLKNEMITALILGGASGSINEFAQAVDCTYDHAKRVLLSLVKDGIAEGLDAGIFQRRITRLPPYTSLSKRVA